jgi:Rod binding domain-containing protein
VTIDPALGPGFAGLPEKAQLRKAALELEGVLVRQLFSTMRQSVPKSGLVDESPASEMFRSMLDDELAKITAEKSPFGLADAIVKRFETAIKPGPAPAEAPNEGAPRAVRFRGIA